MCLLIYTPTSDTIPAAFRITWKLELTLTNLLPKYLPGFEKHRCSGRLFIYKNTEREKPEQSGSFHFSNNINMFICSQNRFMLH